MSEHQQAAAWIAVAGKILSYNKSLFNSNKTGLQCVLDEIDRLYSPKSSLDRIGPITPESDMVICPHCTSQFHAISVNTQFAINTSIELAKRLQHTLEQAE